MPIYEYRCAACGLKFGALVGMVAQPSPPTCPRCAATENASRVVSRPGKFRTEEARLDEIAERIETMGDPDSHAQMRSAMRELGKAGDEDASDEIEEMFENDMEGVGDDE